MRLAILDDYQHAALGLADWQSLQPAVTAQAFHDTLHDEDALVERLRDFEIIVAMRERTKFPRSVIERLPNLKLMITTGRRNASIDTAALAERRIPICGALMSHSNTVELTWALILGIARNIPREYESVRRGGWQTTTLGVEVGGRVLGLLGLGSLGSQVAAIGKAFKMDVIAWSQNLTAERAAEFGVRRVEKEELFRLSDFLSVHLVLSQRTRGLIGAPELAMMKPTAYLINTSRAPIVEQTALVDTLRNHRIAGAAIDVFNQEPVPADEPLLGLDNVLLTPHLGYVTLEGIRRGYREAVEDVRAFLAGKPIRVLGTEW